MPATTRSLLVLLGVPAILAAQTPVRDTTPRPPTRLDEVTVTAAAARRGVASSALSVPRMLIRAVPAQNPYDRLRLAAGLEVHDQGQGPGFAGNASLRGFSSDHSTDLALWIDGVPVNEPVNGHAEGYNDWSLLFPQAVESIEIFKGPTNPLYGNFAMAGVVNVRTLERARNLAIEVEGGAFGRVDASLLSGWDRAHSGGVVAARGMREDGWRRNSRSEIGQVHVRGVRDLSHAATLDAGVELYAAGWESPGFLTREEFDAGEYDHVSDLTDGGYKHRAQERASLRVISGSRMWRSTVYATQGRWQLFLTTPPEGGTTEGSGSQLEEEDRRHGFGGTTALTWAGQHADVTAGLEGRWDHSDYQNWFVTHRVRDSVQDLIGAAQASGALFIQSSEEITPWFRLNLGGRADLLNARVTPAGGETMSSTRALVSPKAGMLIQLPRLLAVYANLSRGFRQTDGVIREPGLPFITAWAYEAGMKLESAKLVATAALFRMDVGNEQTFDPLTARSISGGASRRQGLELSVQSAIGNAARLLGNWTLVDARYRHLVTEEGDTLSGVRVFNTAKYVGSTMLEVAPPRARWNVLLVGNVIGPYSPFDAPGETLPAYGLLHASGGVTAGRVRIEIGIRNLLDRKYVELQAGDFVVPGQPRAVYATLQVRVGGRER